MTAFDALDGSSAGIAMARLWCEVVDEDVIDAQPGERHGGAQTRGPGTDDCDINV